MQRPLPVIQIQKGMNNLKKNTVATAFTHLLIKQHKHTISEDAILAKFTFWAILRS